MNCHLRKNSWLLASLAILGVITPRPAAAASLSYTIKNLAPLDFTNVRATGINNLGQVTGYGGFLYPSAYRTAPNSAIKTGTDDLGGDLVTISYGINSLGQVIGVSGDRRGINSIAFRTAPNKPINPATDDLGSFVGTYASVYGINNLGQVVGSSPITGDQGPFVGNSLFHAFRTAPNKAINPATDDLGTLGSNYSYRNEFGLIVGYRSYAYGINDLGQVVGTSATEADTGGLDLRFLEDNDPNFGGYKLTYHAFRTAPNTAINPATDDLGTLGGSFSIASGINNLGQVVGTSNTEMGDYHAFRTAPNRAINPATDDLGTLGGRQSTASGINNLGQVVGASDGHAFLYTNGKLNDLNSLVAPNSFGGFSDLAAATAINDKGQIVGNGIFPDGNIYPFLATPTAVPEASSGLGILAFGAIATGLMPKPKQQKQK